jgi:hypothetical protein
MKNSIEKENELNSILNVINIVGTLFQSKTRIFVLPIFESILKEKLNEMKNLNTIKLIFKVSVCLLKKYLWISIFLV